LKSLLIDVIPIYKVEGEHKLLQVIDCWKRAWAYYDDVDKSMDNLYESIKKLEIQAE